MRELMSERNLFRGTEVKSQHVRSRQRQAEDFYC